jgi:Tfp pilus assembly protein PilF
MAHDVFISHSSKDKLAADAACAVLEGEGLRCWIAPRDIVPGAEWGASIAEAIGEVKVFVLLFSQHANTSHQIQREVELAVNRGIPIIPVRLEQVAPARSLEFFISSQHWLDAFSPPLQRHLSYLARIIRSLMDGGVTETDPWPQPPPAPPTPAPAPGGLRPWQLAVGAGVATLLVLAAWRLLATAGPTANTNATAPAATNAAAAIAAGPPPTVPVWAGCDESPTVAGCSVIIQQGGEPPQNMAVAYIRRAIAYHGAGQYQLAIADDDAAIRLTPGSAIAFGNRGATYADMGNFAQAIHDYDSAISLDPTFSRAFSNRCFAKAAANQALDQALADCSEALKLSPGDIGALSNRGFVELRLNQPGPALTDLNAALAIDPERADPLYLRALVEQSQGSAAAAATDFAAAKASDAGVAARYARFGLGGG